jgi:hypothetical protein
METKAKPTTPRPLPNSSSVLLALSCLTPPSPILRPSQISTSYTSGDILILLESPVGDVLSSPNSLNAISPSFSTETMGTFGARCRSITQDSSPQLFPNEDLKTFPSTHFLSSVVDTTLHSQEEHNECTRDMESHLGGSAGLTFLSDTPLVYNPSLSCRESASICRPYSSSLVDTTQTAGNSSNEMNAYDDGPNFTPSQTFATLHTVTFYPPSSSPSVEIISHPTSHFKHVFGPQCLLHGKCNDICDSGLALSSSPMNPDSNPPTACGRPNDSFIVDSARPPFEHPSSPTFKADILRHSHNYSKFSFLPENLAWLKDISIELLIDQEGFRSIQPSFRLVGYSSQSRTLGPRDSIAMDSGMVQLIPAARQAFVFHYAPFDSPPVLRRLTVNGDESHDYISRQASLSIKSNGVYTVRGTETSLIAMHSIYSTPNHSFDMKISWQFDYMVSERRVDSTCKFINGERTFTPLTFSCSPALLHSIQGKRVRLMHVVKKSVVPKLVAEKMEPPKLPMAMPTPPSNVLTTIQAITFSFDGIHRRAHSYVHERARNEESSEKLTAVGLKSSAGTRLAKSAIQDSSVPVVGPIRRRRASSAGEHTRAGSNDLRFRLINGADPDPPTQATPPRPRHIVPPSQLCALLSADMESQYSINHHLSLTAGNYRPPIGTTRDQCGKFF